MQDRIVWLPVLPSAPENAQPGASEDADCVRMPTYWAAPGFVSTEIGIIPDPDEDR